MMQPCGRIGHPVHSVEYWQFGTQRYSMVTRIGINGFGRIGRLVLRANQERNEGKVEVAGQRPYRRRDQRPPAQVGHQLRRLSRQGGSQQRRLGGGWASHQSVLRARPVGYSLGRDGRGHGHRVHRHLHRRRQGRRASDRRGQEGHHFRPGPRRRPDAGAGRQRPPVRPRQPHHRLQRLLHHQLLRAHGQGAA